MTEHEQVYASLTSVLLNNANMAVEEATVLSTKALKREAVRDTTHANLRFQEAHQKMLNAVVATNMAIVTTLDELLAVLRSK